MANTEPRMMLGNRRLSEDDWTAMLMVLDAIDGDILAVRKGARKLRSSGKGVEEALAAVKDRECSGRGPLHMAAWAGRLEMCKFLFKDLRLTVDAVGDRGLTPLLYAIFGCGSTSVVRFLLDRGANPNKADTKGFTALHYATMTGTHTDKTEASRMWAANTRDTCEIAELLLIRGAYVDPMSKKGTPLLIAAQDGNVRMVELLLRHQANAMEADPDDSTLYAKRSLCWLHLSEEDKSLDDANTYKAMDMDLSNSCYEQAAALILTKVSCGREYAQACQALMSGLKLDLRSDDLD